MLILIALLIIIEFQLVAVQKQLVAVKKQLNLQQLSEHRKRYLEIAQRLPENVTESNFQLDGRDDYNETMKAMRTYVELCYDLWYLNKRKVMDGETWEMWQDIIETDFSKAAFRQAWRKIGTDTGFGTNFETFISALNFKQGG